MNQQEPSQPAVESKPRKNKIIIGVMVILLIGIIGAEGYSFITSKKTGINKEKGVYLLKSNQTAKDGYSLVNLETGEEKAFISGNYTIIPELGYENQFPEYLMLEKGADIFTYNVESGEIKSIFGSSENLKIKENEQAFVYPSITEKDKFFINVLWYDPTIECEGCTGSSTRSYILDASTNKLQEVGLGFNELRYPYPDNTKYDSKNQRFFFWFSGFGDPGSVPLTIYDIHGNKQNDIVTDTDFGLGPNLGLNEGTKISYQDGLFFITKIKDTDKIITIDPRAARLKKEVYTMDMDKISGSDFRWVIYQQSIVLYKDKGHSTMVVGNGSGDILFLQIDSSNRIFHGVNRTAKTSDYYSSRLFLYNGKLYYRDGENIRVYKLDKWVFEKDIPVSSWGEEITLISK